MRAPTIFFDAWALAVFSTAACGSTTNTDTNGRHAWRAALLGVPGEH